MLKFSKKILVSILAAMAFLFAGVGAQTYKNPVIAGDFPDPSVIRVRKDYYATATSGGWSPHFPILHSKDLVNWEIVGAVFKEKPKWAKGDFWAPEIIQDKGRFFVYYTARRDEGKDKKGTLCVAVAVAEKPDGIYTDKGTLVCQEAGSIDPFFMRDEKNKPYLIWKEDGNDRRQPTWLYAQRLSESGTRLINKPKKMFRNTEAWENHVVEGSFIVRRNGWFYHFYSGNGCCGRECNYALGVARSKTLLGKWEKNPANPILKGNDDWKCPGHGGVVTTPTGRDFFIYHAYNRKDFNVGRQTLLDEIKWTSDGWATINNGQGASNSAKVPIKNTRQNLSKNFLDDFSGFFLSPIWQIPFGNAQSEKLENGFLMLKPDNLTEAIVAKRTVSSDYTATTLIKVDEIGADERAGLSTYGLRRTAVGISVGDGKIFTWRRDVGNTQILTSEKMPNASDIYLRMKVSGGESYNFSFSADGKSWTQLGEAIMSSVENARVALVYGGKSKNPRARFDWVRVEQNN